MTLNLDKQTNIQSNKQTNKQTNKQKKGRKIPSEYDLTTITIHTPTKMTPRLARETLKEHK